MSISAVVLVGTVSPASSDDLRMTCDSGNIHFIGVKGSGQGGAGAETLNMGAEVHAVYKETKKKADAAGLTVKSSSISYPAEPVNTLATWNLGEGVKKYIGSISQGQNSLVQELITVAARWDNQAPQCRNSKFVLAGYSQGAMVIHRVLQNTAILPPTVINRIGGVMLLGDGDRYNGEGSQQGLPILVPGIGQANAAASQSKRINFPASVNKKVYSVCFRGDGVCNAIPGTQLLGFVSHTTKYKNVDDPDWRIFGGNWYREAVNSMLVSAISDSYPPFKPDPPATTTPPTTPPVTTPPTTPPTTAPTSPSHPTYSVGDWRIELLEQSCAVRAMVNTTKPPNLPEKGFWFFSSDEYPGWTNGGTASDGQQYGSFYTVFIASQNYKELPPGKQITTYFKVDTSYTGGDVNTADARTVLTIKWNVPVGDCTSSPQQRTIPTQITAP
ncbi:cutinase family protein [Rhodococcus sp. PvP104]|uniref:cutinase family protein n=1 Tax=Rhodococcus sp. PvP104 TaxID=2817911 RepID=UPI001AE33E79|nr:cutinase family protein [Rhodococcus sp. PvP104]MBP2527332.1 hypothetical protein [Rhodococcus sp. PvP104]